MHYLIPSESELFWNQAVASPIQDCSLCSYFKRHNDDMIPELCHPSSLEDHEVNIQTDVIYSAARFHL